MRRHVLAKYIVVADPQPRGLAGVFQVLGRLPDHAAGIKPVLRANGRLTRQIDVRADDAVQADFHAFINYRVRPNPDRSVQFRPGMYDGCWMDHQANSGTILLISKSKVTCPNNPLPHQTRWASTGLRPSRARIPGLVL